MDEVLIRFPHVGQRIFKNLDVQSITKCRIVSQIQKNFLRNDRLLWKRKIQKYCQNQVQYNKDWKLVTTKVTKDFLKELVYAIEELFARNQDYCKDQLSLHVQTALS